MADTYGVKPSSIAGEIPALFPFGFTSSTQPTLADVQGWITAADTIVTLHVQRAAAVVPSATDQAAPLATRYISATVKAEIMRAVYAGRDPQAVETAAGGYAKQADLLLKEIDQLGIAMTGSGQTGSRVRGRDLTMDHDLLIQDSDLGGLASANVARTRRF